MAAATVSLWISTTDPADRAEDRAKIAAGAARKARSDVCGGRFGAVLGSRPALLSMYDTRAGQNRIGDSHNAPPGHGAGGLAARAARRFPTQPQLVGVATTTRCVDPVSRRSPTAGTPSRAGSAPRSVLPAARQETGLGLCRIPLADSQTAESSIERRRHWLARSPRAVSATRFARLRALGARYPLQDPALGRARERVPLPARDPGRRRVRRPARAARADPRRRRAPSTSRRPVRARWRPARRARCGPRPAGARRAPCWGATSYFPAFVA